MPLRLKTATAVLGFAISATAVQAATGWSVNAGLTHTDNATLVETGKTADTLATVGGSVAWQLETRRIEASLNGAGDFLHYLDNSYRDDFIGQINGHAVIGLVPEHLSWTIDDRFGQIASDPFAPITPNNRQNVNVFSSGPDLHLRLGDQTVVQLAARYGFSRFQDTDQIDQQSWTESVGLLRELSPSATAGVFASQTRYAYDAAGIPLYDQQSAWASWKAGGARQNLTVELGGNRVRSSAESETRPLARVIWHRRVRPAWTMDLQLSSEYMNAGQQFAVTDVVNVGISTLPAATRRADLAFVYEQPRTRFSLGGGVRKLSYEGAAQLDEKGWTLRADLSRRFTPHTQGFTNYRLDQRDYETGRSIREQVAQAGLDWQLTGALFLTLSYAHTESSGDVVLNRYGANLVSARISWRSGDSTPRARLLGY